MSSNKHLKDKMIELPVRIADYEPDFEVKTMVFEAPKQKYNRAKDKREFEKRIEEELEC